MSVTKKQLVEMLEKYPDDFLVKFRSMSDTHLSTKEIVSIERIFIPVPKVTSLKSFIKKSYDVKDCVMVTVG